MFAGHPSILQQHTSETPKLATYVTKTRVGENEVWSGDCESLYVSMFMWETDVANKDAIAQHIWDFSLNSHIAQAQGIFAIYQQTNAAIWQYVLQRISNKTDKGMAVHEDIRMEVQENRLEMSNGQALL